MPLRVRGAVPSGELADSMVPARAIGHGDSVPVSFYTPGQVRRSHSVVCLPRETDRERQRQRGMRGRGGVVGCGGGEQGGDVCACIHAGNGVTVGACGVCMCM